jgi:hypothetical protein
MLLAPPAYLEAFIPVWRERSSLELGLEESLIVLMVLVFCVPAENGSVVVELLLQAHSVPAFLQISSFPIALSPTALPRQIGPAPRSANPAEASTWNPQIRGNPEGHV